MKSVSNWLHAMLKSHVLPDDKVTKQHNTLIELRMKQMEELLPSVNKVFEEVKVEMAGSVQSNSKVSNMYFVICFLAKVQSSILNSEMSLEVGLGRL